MVGLAAARRAPRRCCAVGYTVKLAALRLESEEKDLSAMAWVLKMDDATIESGLVHDFDASLSGIGQELGAGAYSMRLEQHAPQSTAFKESIINLRAMQP